MKSMSVSKALANILKSCHLRPIKSMTFTFDPYSRNVRSIRDAVYMLNLEKVLDTNPNCRSKIDIKNDRSEPKITVDFSDGERYIFKTSNLTTEDLVTKIAYLCDEKDTKIDMSSMTTKKTKLKGGKK